MQLGNILKQAARVVETGRPVRFQLKVSAGRGTKSSRVWVDALILPLSEQERMEAVAAARDYCADHPEADADDERALHLAAAFLRDADDASKRLVMSTEMAHLRGGLISPQVLHLLGEYAGHIANEYPELQPKRTRAELEAQIAGLQKQLQALTEEAAGE